MKLKKMTLFATTVILASQFTVGITTLATIDDNKFQITDSEKVEEEVLEDGIEFKETDNNSNEIQEKKELEIKDASKNKEKETVIIGPKTFSETRDSNVTIESPVLWIPLGARDETVETIFREGATVKEDGKILTGEDYSMLGFSSYDSQFINYRTSYNFLFPSLRTSGNLYAHEAVEHGINYGSSIVFESDDNVSAAFTFNEDYYWYGSSFYISASLATGKGSDMINSKFKDKEYFKVDLFKKKMGSIIIDEDTEPDYSITAKGNDTKNDIVSKWGRQRADIDSVVRVWSAEPSDSKLYNSIQQNTTKKNYADENGYTYYRVTEKGFEHIEGQMLKTVVQDIYTTTTNEELDEIAEQSFESIPEGVEVIGFTEYPNRTKEGEATGKIKVREKSQYTQNKVIDTIYPVSFNVTETPIIPLEVEFKEVDILLGSARDSKSPYEFIEAVYFDGEELSEDEYIAEFIEEPFPMKIGVDDEVEIEVTLKEDKNISVIGLTTANMIWGNTLVSRTDVSTKSEMLTSISLLEDSNKPQLKMTYGTGSNNRIRSGNDLQIYRGNTGKVLFSEREYYSWKTQLDTINTWQPKLDKIDFEYGDVLKQTIFDHRDINVSGTHTYVSRSEELIKETEGYEDAFYEMTPNGYNLLQLNQIRDKNSQLSLDLKTGDSQEKINEQITSKIIIPDTVKDKTKYRFEAENIDTQTSGKRKGNINIYEQLATGGEFMLSFEISYEVVQGLKVELNENTIPVGTPLEKVNANDYIKSVSNGTTNLEPTDYTVEIDKTLNTKLVGSQDTKITVKVGNNEVTSKTKTNIIWGNSIVTKVNDNVDAKIDASVSMLDSNGKPYLVANEGTGFASGNLYNRPYIAVLRDSTEEVVFGEAGYHSTNASAKDTMDKWNNGDDKTEALGSKEYQYGDVFRYRVNKNSAANTSEMGNKTWVSRNETLVKETVGYDAAYYEMTKEGFRLMQLNQLKVNTTIPVVAMNTTIEEMNKSAKDAMTIPGHIENPENYRFEYASVDTKTSGLKETNMNVYEKLSTGGEFKTTYKVKYQVNPQLTETFSDTKGNQIADKKVSNFNLGDSMQPKAENYINFNDDVYIYKGWLAGDKTPGKDQPNEGEIRKVTKEETIHYIYEKADNYINVTIPTSMMVTTNETGKDIVSEVSEIKNNSDKVSTEITLKEFNKKSSEIELLKKNDKDPKGTDKSARLNLTMDGNTAVGSLNDTTKDEFITTLNPTEKTSIGMSGTYFGSRKDSAYINYNMLLKFKAK